MPSFTIENTSPLIQYQPVGAWREGDKLEDPEAGSYSGNSTFTLTTVPDASAQFNFTGTSLVIGGAKRVNHGSYTVTLDGVPSTFDGSPPTGPEEFQVPLFKADGLEPGEHTVAISNQPQGNKVFLDIDFITWSSPSLQDDVTDLQWIQDTQFTYEPADAWSTDTKQLPDFKENSGHFSTQEGASATIDFEGTGLSLFSAVGPDQAPYTVSLDGQASKAFTAVKSDYYPQQMIYHADRLASGKHTVMLVCQPGGQSCSVDYALVYKSDFGVHSKLSTGAIAGLVIGILVFLGLCIAGAVFFFRRRRHNQRTHAWRAGYPERAASVPTILEPGSSPSPSPLPPLYIPTQPGDRISAWRDQTRAATMDPIQTSPSPNRTIAQDYRTSLGTAVTGSAGGHNFNATLNAQYIPKPFAPSVHSSPSPSIYQLRPPTDQSQSPSPSTSRFWPTRKKTLGEVHSDLAPEPRFGQDVGNGMKFVDLA